MNAISQASKNVSGLLGEKLVQPPVLVDTIREQEFSNIQEDNSSFENVVDTINVVRVHEIWEVYLGDIDDKKDIETIFIVISGDNKIKQKYEKGDWNNIEYQGFYSTLEEAKNNIKGYLD
jgi:hypothetical protein